MKDTSGSETISQLQSQLSFQEHELEKLHQALYDQQRRIDALELQLKRLAEQYREVKDQFTEPMQANQKPPHY